MSPAKRLILFFITTTIVFVACRKVETISEDEILARYLNLPASPFNYAHYPLPQFFEDQFIVIQNNTPGDNVTTDWGATLGRVLFYDKRLSRNLSISCASCHDQKFGFADTAQFSKGFDGQLTRRHSMALVNATFYISGRFFWDERAATLEEQVLTPIQDPIEMGMRLDSLVNRLEATEFYPILFKLTFGSTEISESGISRALAQFVRSMVSYRSKYDEGRSLVGDSEMDFPNFSTQENIGKQIFLKNINVNCAGCHNTDVFITDNPRNNGVSKDNDDPGVFVHTQDVMDVGKFKAPSLKNVAIRGRFMHDGSIQGLGELLDHYNSGIHPNSNLDPHIKDKDGKPARMNLTVTELEALKAFLETLTDHAMVTDERFSSPFID